MRRGKLSKFIALLLAGSMLTGMITGCGSAKQETDSVQATSEMAVEATTEADIMDFQEGSILGSKIAEAEGMEEIRSDVSASLHVSTSGIRLSSTPKKTLDNVSYVMIYNPYCYDEEDEYGKEIFNSLSTGSFGKQIVTGISRAGGLEDDFELPEVISQKEINQDVMDLSEANREDGRASGIDPVYNKGDKHSFYRYDANLTYRFAEEFKCVYKGKNCYIWSSGNSISENDAAKVGEEFDNKIYPGDVETFGYPRFVENGGKVNLLYYPMQRGLCGFFSMSDIYASNEASEAQTAKYGLNHDHAIININSNLLGDEIEVYATMAHEFQHLICASDIFNYYRTPLMDTWLNEAMSAYAEKMIYPGSKEKGYYNQMYYLSNNFRKGQSLYNFSTRDIENVNERDRYLGAYGVVYLYSLYLEELSGGKKVFSNIHNYWKYSYDPYTNEITALITSLPGYVVRQINDSYVYPTAIRSKFSSAEEEWMSKLTLDFYLETLSMDLASLNGLEDAVHKEMLYSQVNPVDIQGGGRLLIAVNGNSFTIPDDADPELIYIGLDKNFKICTDLISVE